ncbi:hypothetical protein HTSR_1417 [Halodesulfurarchaeum formicicum]|uniref:Uncharacterized protein n=1 Tax=Halodesulfurarchaeum formicicum TaxID=1873524 RepID=A0A1D8S5G6_9EURY|nr:hypothetical protein [Halodesulfurarchaeum formicicum]AOW80593.1 hypothetical protein HTSR_1417 [Halodesulfurarchaeum formicicum]
MTDGDADSARVEELAATVDGLTTELLDLQERVRLLEAELEDETDTDRSVEEMFAAESSTDEKADRDVETIGDDIIVG